jgi:hypothetical protein
MTVRCVGVLCLLVCFGSSLNAGPELVCGLNPPARWLGPSVPYYLDQSGFDGLVPRPSRVGDSTTLAFSAWQISTAAVPTGRLVGLTSIHSLAEYLAFFYPNTHPTPRGIFVFCDPKNLIVDQLDYKDEQRDKDEMLGATFWRAAPYEMTWAAVFMRRGSSATPDLFRWVLTHEIGHALGLSDTLTRGSADSKIPDLLNPLMHFRAPSAVLGPPQLSADDEAWVSSIYPKPTNPEERKTFTSIEGHVRYRNDLKAVLGVNVIAIPLLPTTDQEVGPVPFRRVAVLSGFRGLDEGEFELPVKPGRYRIVVESIPVDNRSIHLTLCSLPQDSAGSAPDSFGQIFVKTASPNLVRGVVHQVYPTLVIVDINSPATSVDFRISR